MLLALGLVELGLRTVPPPQGYFTLVPGAEWTLSPTAHALPGIEGESHTRINHFGVRGRMFGDDAKEFRILAVGGSTTLCSALDDSEVWTHLVETGLDTTSDGRHVWVGNVGRDGATTRDHVLHLKYLLPQYPRIDVIVSLIGVNDMTAAVHQGWSYRARPDVTEPAAERAQLAHAFAVFPGLGRDQGRYGDEAVAWYRRTALWQLARRVKQTWEHWRLDSRRVSEERLDRFRRERAAATTWIDSLPPLEAPLAEYRQNLNAMASAASAAGVHLVFVTPPTAWRAGMTRADQRLLWFGPMQGPTGTTRAYFTPDALSRAMQRYNETTLAVCHERHLDCLDAAALIPHDSTTMYDDVHFNERGSQLLARALIAFFRDRAPFR